ncbi:sigma-70 family RNA polymerase sigma factor [Streptomyces sp. NPDC002766]|uniref:sigma-70 family RNA polymerase sigma factor n=1 Tax=Streptomyces sp. NPDC002766 TaxID=3154429 RepID=UPI003332966E
MSPRSGRTPKAASVPRQRGMVDAEGGPMTNRSTETGMAKDRAEVLRPRDVVVPWYDKNFERIAGRVIRALSCDRQEAESVIHDVCVRLLVKLREGEAPFGEKKFEMYAEKCISNAITDRYRQNGRNRQVPIDENEGLYDPEPFVEERMVLRRVLSELPEKQRRVIELFFYEGMKPAQIAEELAITSRSVSTYKSNGLRSMREHPAVARLIEKIDG